MERSQEASRGTLVVSSDTDNRASKGLKKAPEHVRKRFVEALDALLQSFAPVKLFDVKKTKGLRRYLQG